MKFTRKAISVLLAVIMCLSVPIFAFASDFNLETQENVVARINAEYGTAFQFIPSKEQKNKMNGSELRHYEARLREIAEAIIAGKNIIAIDSREVSSVGDPASLNSTSETSHIIAYKSITHAQVTLSAYAVQDSNVSGGWIWGTVDQCDCVGDIGYDIVTYDVTSENWNRQANNTLIYWYGTGNYYYYDIYGYLTLLQSGVSQYCYFNVNNYVKSTAEGLPGVEQ